MSLQCGLCRLKHTLLTCSGHGPTLHKAIVRSAQEQAFTPPKQSEPVTASLPEGAYPVTSIVRRPAGSSLSTVIVADFEPKLVGSKRSGISSEFPGEIVTGQV